MFNKHVSYVYVLKHYKNNILQIVKYLIKLNNLVTIILKKIMRIPKNYYIKK